VVLSAEPGSGKTTLVPLMLMDEAWLVGRSILMLEPRRPAARMAARRMAALRGEAVGDSVGYRVRFERRVSAATRIEVLTEGLLLRRLQADPALEGVGLVIFDEFHERNLPADLSLALCLDVCEGLREDLRLLVMSASLDVGPLLSLMPANPVVCEGRQHPVALHYAARDPEAQDLPGACLRMIELALAESSGDVLVFLPGRREIERLREAVTARWGVQLDALALYGDLPAVAQDQVLQGPGKRRRVILATDIAETSLTIEGVEAVVDSGQARRPVFDPNTGLTRLETRRISKASALQRAGRAGRLGPGRCYRLWSEARHARLLDWTPAEILEADLAPLVLELANWGVTRADAMRWLDAPPAAHWQQAVELLRSLGALDGQGRITAAGRRMMLFPTHPRLAHMLAAARGAGQQRVAADLAALLSERDPLRRSPGADVDTRLEALQALRSDAVLPVGADRRLLRRADRVAKQFLRHCDVADDPTPAAAGVMLALAYPDRIAACASPDGRRYLMRNGRAALLGELDPLRGHAFLVIAELDAGLRDGRVWLAATLDRTDLEAMYAGRIEASRELRWEPGLSDVVARSVRCLDALRLADESVALQPDDPVQPLLLAQIRSQGLAGLLDDPVTWRARVLLMGQLDPAGDWPDFSEDALLDRLEDWLLPWLKPGQGVRQLRSIRVHDLLAAELGWERQQQLDRWLPTHYETPAGTRRRIAYGIDTPPTLAVPLQEMLGLEEGPRLADGRLPLLLHLLSPAGRPLQITTDLAAFWEGAYDAVKKEMRGRYPKHYWPDDPAAARATRFTKRRM
jgi:ATP-dependent helicase HrpB